MELKRPPPPALAPGHLKPRLTLMDLPIDILRLVIRELVEFEPTRIDNLARILRLRRINGMLATPVQ